MLATVLDRPSKPQSKGSMVLDRAFASAGRAEAYMRLTTERIRVAALAGRPQHAEHRRIPARTVA